MSASKNGGERPIDTPMYKTCHIALGANLASAARSALETLTEATVQLKSDYVNVTSLSRWFKSPAFPAGSGPDYVNGVARIETVLTPEALLAHLARIESALGRVREERWGARVCDLDLVDFAEAILPNMEVYAHWRDLPLERQMQETPPELVLPHPRLQDRAFVLVPLRQVAPDWAHPVSGQHIDDLIAALPPGDVAQMHEISGK